MADIFDVIADPTRRALLHILLEQSVAADSDSGELSVGELVERLGASQPTVSKHLKVLRDHGLVTARDEAQHRYYSLEPAPLEEVEDWLIPFLTARYEAVGFDEEPAAAGSAGEPAPLSAELRGSAAAIGRRAAAAAHRLTSLRSVGRRVADRIR